LTRWEIVGYNRINLTKEKETMTKRQKKNLLGWIDMYRHYLIINLTDKKVYNDPWQRSDVCRLDRHLKTIKQLIMEKAI
jgi:hypothetical protein